MSAPDPRIEEAEAMAIEGVAGGLDVIGPLKKHGREWAGACPRCGGDDRFSLNTTKNVWHCRKGCTDFAAGNIGLVRLVRDCTFREALDYLVGAGEATLPPEEQERRARARAEDQRRRAARAANERRKAINMAVEIWGQGVPCSGTPVEEYLLRRKLPPGIAARGWACLRYHPALRYTINRDRQWVSIHEGPAMLAGVLSPDGQLTACHRTWIDLDHPKGKWVPQENGDPILDGKGKPLPSKKVLGSKKGGAIRFTEARASTLIVGEGIETTLTALAAGYAGADFWCAVDLGNMAGQRMLGKGQKYEGIPDLTDEDAWLPPPWVERLIYLQDSDSDPRLTRSKLMAGLRRARVRVPSVQSIQIVAAADGMDLNDMIGTEVEP